MADNVFVLASVRHPVQHFMLMFRETEALKVVQRLTNNETLEEYDAMKILLRNPELVQKTFITYDNNVDNENDSRHHHRISLIQPNIQSYSLGITESTSQMEFTRRLHEIHFIVVAEHFDESMLVLREKLCCSVEDVVYRRKQTSNEQVVFIPEDLQKLVLEFNNKDARLYKYALDELHNELNEFSNLDQMLGIYHHELDKHEKKCNHPNIPESFKSMICPPLSHSGIKGGIAFDVLKEQKSRLLKRLRAEYQHNENDLSKN